DLARTAHVPRGLPLLTGWLEVGRELGVLAEEELLGLVPEDLVRARVRRRQAVLVHDHLEVLEPELPRVLTDAVVDALVEIVVERLEREPGQLLAELLANHHPSHRAPSPRTGARRNINDLGRTCRLNPWAGAAPRSRAGAAGAAAARPRPLPR